MEAELHHSSTPASPELFVPSSTTKATEMMRLARKISLTSSFDRVKIGAVIAKGTTVLALASNRPKSHPMQFKFNNKAKRIAPRHHVHAEMGALINAEREGINVRGSTIYVYRRLASGALGCSKPCAACEAALKEAGIRNVYWTSPHGYLSCSIE